VKSVPVWIWYTALRILLFAVPLAVLLLAGVNPWVSAAVAAVFGLSASLIFLRRQRESIASDLYAARHRDTPAVRDDDAEEDAAVDATSRDRDADADADKSAG
jgi:outer membrane murein-binding lipoprotein Lpp